MLEPFYENYGPDAILCGAVPVYVPLAQGEPLDLIASPQRSLGGTGPSC